MQSSLSTCGGLLICIWDIVEQQKEHFEGLFGPVDMPSLQEVVPEISGALGPNFSGICSCGYYNGKKPSQRQGYMGG